MQSKLPNSPSRLIPALFLALSSASILAPDALARDALDVSQPPSGLHTPYTYASLAGPSLSVRQMGADTNLPYPAPFRGRYMAAIPERHIRSFLALQNRSQWCWAAIVQTVLNYHGVDVLQEDVVRRIYGALVNRPGSLEDILEALSGFGPLENGGTARLEATPLGNVDDVFNDLVQEQPVIVGLNNPHGGTGHGFVLVALTYDVDGYGARIFRSVILLNPWPFGPAIEELSWSEFNQKLGGFARVRVVPLR